MAFPDSRSSPTGPPHLADKVPIPNGGIYGPGTGEMKPTGIFIDGAKTEKEEIPRFVGSFQTTPAALVSDAATRLLSSGGLVFSPVFGIFATLKNANGADVPR